MQGLLLSGMFKIREVAAARLFCATGCLAVLAPPLACFHKPTVVSLCSVDTCPIDDCENVLGDGERSWLCCALPSGKAILGWASKMHSQGAHRDPAVVQSTFLIAIRFSRLLAT